MFPQQIQLQTNHCYLFLCVAAQITSEQCKIIYWYKLILVLNQTKNIKRISNDYCLKEGNYTYLSKPKILITSVYIKM